MSNPDTSGRAAITLERERLQLPGDRLPGGREAQTAANSSVESFKNAFREHPAAVAIITARDDTGPVGLTASSVASIGIDPLAISFSVTRATGSAGAILQAETFIVHLLADRHVDIARAFAQSDAPRFTPDHGFVELGTGEPYLADSRVAFRCRHLVTIPVGGSSLVAAEVLEVRSGAAGIPLLYHDRQFRTLSDIQL